ncbi:acyl carrier protein [Streptomyces finlayi]|nr:phosphopantetheine-binding protein [Streptomyces finlayi]
MQESEVLETVTGIWKEVLLVDVDAASDFFEEGGHSLAVMQLVNRLQENYGVEMSIGDIFEYPTLGEFSAAVHGRVTA